jgi:hypothetical protein
MTNFNSLISFLKVVPLVFTMSVWTRLWILIVARIIAIENISSGLGISAHTNENCSILFHFDFIFNDGCFVCISFISGSDHSFGDSMLLVF